MKQKTKLVSLIISFCLMLTLLVAGVFALKNTTVPMGGTINFKADGIEATISNAVLTNAKLAERADSDGSSLKTPAEIGKLQDITFSTNGDQDDHADKIPTWARLYIWVNEGETEVKISFDITNRSKKPIYVSLNLIKVPQNVTITKVGADKIAAKSEDTETTEHFDIVFSIDSEYDITNAEFSVDFSLSFEESIAKLASYQTDNEEEEYKYSILTMLKTAGMASSLSEENIKTIKFTQRDNSSFNQMRGKDGTISLEQGVTNIESSKILANLDTDGNLEITSTQKIQAPQNSAWLFGGLDSLTSLDLTNLSTVGVTKMNGMFNCCVELSSLDVRNFDTSQVTDMSDMFNGCGFESIDVGGFDTSKVTNMLNMFQCCGNLRVLDLSNFDTSNVTNMRRMFQGCTKLTNLNISNFNTSKVVEMFAMFADCSSLENLDVSSFDTSNVEYMGEGSSDGMFSGCSSLKSLDLSNFNTKKVVSMSGMFCNCSSLTSLDVSNFDTSGLYDMNSMFAGCTSLANIDISGFDTTNMYDICNAFENCTSLTSLDISCFGSSVGGQIPGAITDCSNLKTIYVGDAEIKEIVETQTDIPSGCQIIIKNVG